MRKQDDRVSSLKPLGFGLLAGVKRRSRLIFHEQTMEALFRTAIAAEGERTTLHKSLKIVPTFGPLSSPLWQQPSFEDNLYEQVQGRIRRKLVGKQSTLNYAAAWAIRVKGTKRMKSAPIKVIASATTWSDNEKRELAGLTGGAKHLVEKKLLHNRTAASKGKHVIGPVLDSSSNMLPTISCLKCGREAKRSHLSVWLGLPCEGRTASGRLRESAVQQRQQVMLDKLAAAGHKATVLNGTVVCSLCQKEKPVRRYDELLKPPCQAAAP